MFEIRLAHKDDLPDLAELERLCFDKPWQPSQLASLTAHYPNAAVAEEFALVVTAEEEKIVAYIGWQRVFDEADLLSLAVHPDKRRQGLAKKLIEASESKLKQAAVTLIRLEVSEQNKAARTLYQALGFEDYGERKNYYAAGESARLMQRKLK